MPAVFDKLGLHFQYPDNWTVETDDVTPGRQTVSVYSPGGGFWTVALRRATVDPMELAQAALKTLTDEYQDLDSEAVEETVGNVDLVGFDVNFYCLDLTNTALIRAGVLPGGGRSKPATYLIVCQAEDREFDQVSPVFRAMTFSLLAK